MTTNLECSEHGSLVSCFACRNQFCYYCWPKHDHGSDVQCYICADKGCQRCLMTKTEELKRSGRWDDEITITGKPKLQEEALSTRESEIPVRNDKPAKKGNNRKGSS